jgi:adenylate cyclase
MAARLSQHGFRTAATLIALFLALLHALQIWPIRLLERLDHFIYDVRLQATMPNTRDERIVIVDIDEKSLAQVGRWPWGRHTMAALTEALFEQHKVALVAFDVVFAEADDSSGLKRLRELASHELKSQTGFARQLSQMEPHLDHDARFARALQNRPVVLSYYLSNDGQARTSGVLPRPVMRASALQDKPVHFPKWTGFGASISQIANAAPMAGYINPVVDPDGVIRSMALVSEYQGQYYEALSLAVFRLLTGLPEVSLGFGQQRVLPHQAQSLESIVLKQGSSTVAIAVDPRAAALVPYRGRGHASGASFNYISAADVLARRVPPDALAGKIVLVGATAPGLFDLRVTPVGAVFPGVEVHANMISGLLDGRFDVKPAGAAGYEVLLLLLVGMMLAFAWPRLSAAKAVALTGAVLVAVVGLHTGLYLGAGLVLPLAATLAMVLTAFALNMSYGYFVESQSKRQIAQLFGTYVPPELVNEMVKDPHNYSMKAANKELTVMFCDLRGFTQMSETMEPTQLQALLNQVFNRITQVISQHRGTIDKYMGDCVMAFWGAPVQSPEHAALAVGAALEIVSQVRQINAEHRSQGLPQISVGIGLNTGSMCVGDMGSSIRKSYTVIGDAVNLGSRLEGLSQIYGVDVVASESTQTRAPAFAWQELDKVRVKGKAQTVTIYTPIAPLQDASPETHDELKRWNALCKPIAAKIGNNRPCSCVK